MSALTARLEKLEIAAGEPDQEAECLANLRALTDQQPIPYPNAECQGFAVKVLAELNTTKE